MTEVATVEQSPAEFRGAILALESVMLQMKDKQVEIATKHYFSDGVYAREIFIPKGVTLTGKIHKTAHLNIISQGELTVWTEEGMKRLKAPCSFVSQPGTKRVGYAHEDTVWTTIHGTNETDLLKLEDQLIAKSFDELPLAEKKLLEET